MVASDHDRARGDRCLDRPDRNPHSPIRRCWAAGAELVASPSQLSVTFSEPVDVSGDGLVVRGPQGLVELAGDAVEVAGDRTVVARPAEALPAGSYTFGWTVTANDGDVLTGTVPFTVSAAAAATPGRPPPYAPVGPDEAAGGSTAGAATGAALRWLLFLGLSLALGGVVGARLVAGVPGFGAPQPPLAFGGGLVAVAATGSALHTLGPGIRWPACCPCPQPGWLASARRQRCRSGAGCSPWSWLCAGVADGSSWPPCCS